MNKVLLMALTTFSPSLRFDIIFRNSTFISIFFLTSCYFKFPVLAQQSTPLLKPTSNITQPSNSTNYIQQNSISDDYVLGPGDSIKIKVFKVEDYSGDYLVAADGTISMPLVGKVKVEGLSVQETMKLLSQKYSPYLKVPSVTVTLLTARPLKIHVTGEVNRPGAYEIEGKQQIPSVTSILELAGGITTTADISQVQIRRSSQGREQILQANLWDYLQQGNKTQDMVLRDGDVIFVPTVEQSNSEDIYRLTNANFGIKATESINVAVVGEVNRPGTYEISAKIPGNLQNNNSDTHPIPPTLTEAIKEAGGIKPLANIRQVEIRRLTRTGSQQKIQVNLWELLKTGNIAQDPILQQGDTIIIPTASRLDPSEASTIALASFSPATIRVNVVGEVKQPGVVEVPPNTPLNQALMAAGGFDMERANKNKVELIRLNTDGTASRKEIEVNFSQGINENTNPILQANDVIIVNRSKATATNEGLGTLLKPLEFFFPFLRLF